MEFLGKFMTRIDTVILLLLFLGMWFWFNHIFIEIGKALKNNGDKIEGIERKLSYYIFNIANKNSKEMRTKLDHIFGYVKIDFESIRTYILSVLLTDNFEKEFSSLDKTKKSEAIVKNIMEYVSSNILGTTQEKLMKEGYDKNITNKVQETTKNIYPLFLDYVEDLVEVYVTGNGRRAKIIPNLLEHIITETEQRYLTMLENFLLGV